MGDSTYYLNHAVHSDDRRGDGLDEWMLRRSDAVKSYLVDSLDGAGDGKLKKKEKRNKSASSSSGSRDKVLLKIDMKKGTFVKQKETSKKKHKRHVKVIRENSSDSSSSDSIVIFEKKHRRKPKGTENEKRYKLKSDAVVQCDLLESDKIEGLNSTLGVTQKKQGGNLPVPQNTIPRVPETEKYHIETRPKEEPKPKAEDKPITAPLVETPNHEPPIPVTTSGVSESQANADLISQLGLGIKLTTQEKKVIIKPKYAKSHHNLDRRLYDLGAILTSKSKSKEEKQQAEKIFIETNKSTVFWKVMVSEEGKSKDFSVLDLELRDLNDVALKVYVQELDGEGGPQAAEKKNQIVGGLYWCEAAKMTRVRENKNFETRAMSLSEEEDEKEITKVLKGCLKADKPEI